jgi:hypothetical protein
MQKFDYRTPRFAVDFPVQLKIQDALHFARCRDISEDGMRLELREPFPPRSCGEVFFSYKNLSLDLRVRVTHAGDTYDGLKFIHLSEEERTKIFHLMSRLAVPRRAASLCVIN